MDIFAMMEYWGGGALWFAQHTCFDTDCIKKKERKQTVSLWFLSPRSPSLWLALQCTKAGGTALIYSVVCYTFGTMVFQSSSNQTENSMHRNKKMNKHMLFVFLQTFEVNEIKRKKKKETAWKGTTDILIFHAVNVLCRPTGLMLRWLRYMVELHTKWLAEVNANFSIWRRKLCLHQILECGICIILSWKLTSVSTIKLKTSVNDTAYALIICKYL